MRLLAIVLAVLVGGSTAQVSFYPRALLRPIAPFGYSRERVVTQGRISTGAPAPVSSLGSASSSDPCRPNPCGDFTYCEVNNAGVGLCYCIDGYVPNPTSSDGCKPQCTSSDDCPDDYRCQANKCVRVCGEGACALRAECKAVNHQAQCSCPPRFRGDPYARGCFQEEIEERVAPPAVYVSPCEASIDGRSPCARNADCRVSRQGDVERAVCSCPFGYEGNPLVECRKAECTEDRDCRSHQACQRQKCIDPCTVAICAPNSECRTENHVPICSCPRGYVGDPFRSCRRFELRELCEPSPCGPNTNCRVDSRSERAVCSCIDNYFGDPLATGSGGCRPECVSDSDCRGTDQVCQNNICVNPCVGLCGENAYCNVRNRRATCSCPEYYQGDPYSRCFAECTQHDDCFDSQACVKLRCVDPCLSACGTGANCKVERHKAICSCPRTHTGDPFRSCRPFTREDYCNPNPCGTNAICTPGTDRSGNDRPVCTCPTGYIGNPTIACDRGDCERNDQCPQNEACYQYECKSPCYSLDGSSVCGENAQCTVKNHKPVCSCPPGYIGNPLSSCYTRGSSGVGGFFSSSEAGRVVVGRTK